jgi:hypothetical protein
MTETDVKAEEQAKTAETPESAPPKLREPQKPRKTKYFVSRKNWLVRCAMTLTALSVLFRLIAYWGFWSDPTSDATYSQVFLPILCCVLFMVFVEVLGKSALWTTALPVFFTSVFLILETFSVTPWWVKALSILLYVVAACVYAMTVLGKIRTKWLLVVTIGTPLVYHLAVQDRTTLLNASTPATLVQWMPELSAMSFLIALLFTALAVEKVPPPFQYDPRAELPQIRGLRYVPDELEYHRPAKAEKLPVKTEEKLPPAPEAAAPEKNCEEANNNTP